MQSLKYYLELLKHFGIIVKTNQKINRLNSKDSFLVTSKLKFSINSVYFDCMICHDEKDISDLDIEELPITSCKTCSVILKVDELYKRQFKQGRL